ncbi:hypothetical protein J6590_080101 [Homalodisca vitripennis]|nr:hypothetical protein J6590_080101 [Homalodisca vitripennis]
MSSQDADAVRVSRHRPTYNVPSLCFSAEYTTYVLVPTTSLQGTRRPVDKALVPTTSAYTDRILPNQLIKKVAVISESKLIPGSATWTAERRRPSSFMSDSLQAASIALIAPDVRLDCNISAKRRAHCSDLVAGALRT